MSDHLWLPTDIEGEEGDDVAVVTFECQRCPLTWRTYTSLTMPADYEPEDCPEGEEGKAE